MTILANGKNLKNEKKGKIKIIRCWDNNSLLIPFNILLNILKENPDIVHFNVHMRSWGRTNFVNFFAHLTPILIKLFLKKKVIITLHNILESVNLKEIGVRSPLVIFGAKLITKLLLRSDKVVVLLKRYKKVLLKKYKRKNVAYIPHGTLGKKTKYVKFSRNRILTFGFWSPYKNLHLLLEVFAELKKKYRNLELIVAGASHPIYPKYLEMVKQK